MDMLQQSNIDNPPAEVIAEFDQELDREAREWLQVALRTFRRKDRREEADKSDEDGHWVTINGAHILIKGASDASPDSSDGKTAAALSKIETPGRADPVLPEIGYIINDGKVVHTLTVGSKNVVGVYGPKERPLLKNAVYTHNHPVDGAPLSHADIAFAAWGNVAEIRAFGINQGKQVVYSVKRPDKGWPKDHLKILSAFRREDERARAKYLPMVKDGKLTLEQAFEAGKRDIWQKVGAKFGFTMKEKRL